MSRRLAATGALAAFSALVLIAAAAHAQPGLKTFTDPQNRFSFQYPADWPVDTLPGSTPTNTGIAVGAADAECKVIASRSDQSAGKPADAIQRAYTAPIGDAAWKTKADAYNLWSRRGTVNAAAVDTSKFWPVQTATFTTDEGKPGFGALQSRPGIEVWMFCNSFDSRDRKAVFDEIFASFAGPDDAALIAAGQASAAARTAQQSAADAEAAAAAERAAKQQQKKKR